MAEELVRDVAAATVWRYLLTQTHVVTHYLRLVVWPSPLVFLYTWPLATSLGAVSRPAALMGALVALTIVGTVWRHPLGFAGAWFFLVLAPTSSVVPIVTEVAAEHRMYLLLASPVACVVVGACLAGQRAAERIGLRAPVARRAGLTLAAALTVAAIAVWAAATRARNRDYWSAERLWQRTVEAQPTNQRARVAYGEALADAGRYVEAEAEYQAAVDLAPADPLAHVRLGGVQAAQGKLDAAIPHYLRALASRPDDIEAHRALGLAYAVRRQDARAIPQLEQAITPLIRFQGTAFQGEAKQAHGPDADRGRRNRPRLEVVPRTNQILATGLAFNSGVQAFRSG